MDGTFPSHMQEWQARLCACLQESLVSGVVEAACHLGSSAITNAALQALASIGSAFPELTFTHSMQVSSFWPQPYPTLQDTGSEHLGSYMCTRCIWPEEASND